MGIKDEKKKKKNEKVIEIIIIGKCRPIFGCFGIDMCFELEVFMCVSRWK